jgi:hypothetical protein
VIRLKITKAKVRTDTAIENLRELQRTQGNIFSLTGLVSGVYILDIIAQKDNREDLAYETIMVILDPGETTITANLQIINMEGFSGPCIHIPPISDG